MADWEGMGTRKAWESPGFRHGDKTQTDLLARNFCKVKNGGCGMTDLLSATDAYVDQFSPLALPFLCFMFKMPLIVNEDEFPPPVMIRFFS